MPTEIVYIDQTPESDCVLVRAVIGGNLCNVLIPTAAIANRQQIYGLSAERDVIEAILREHATRILSLPADNHEDLRIAQMAGLRQDVTVRQGGAADLPPVVPAPRTPKQALADAVAKASTLAEIKAAVLAFANS